MQSFFPTAEIVGFVKSKDSTGVCDKASGSDLAKFKSPSELDKIRDLELVTGELTDNEVYAFAMEIWWEVQAKLARYSNMYRHEHGEDQNRRFRLCAGSLEKLYAETSIYSRKDDVYETAAELFEVPFAKPKSRGCGVWCHRPRAPLDQTQMSTPTDVLCGIKRIGVSQPDFLVRAGALATLASDQRRQGRRKRLAVQRVGETLCIANSKYEGDLNMNSQGLQLERVLCGMPQYLQPGMPEFDEYSHKQIFVIRQAELSTLGKRLCTYYHAFAQSNEKKYKGRIQVDSSGDPGRYRLRSGVSLKDTCFQMWARGQRFLHHCEWDRCKELLMVRLQVCELEASETGADEAGSPAHSSVARENPDEPNIPFEEGAIQVCVRNNNRVVKRPLQLSECCTIEELSAQAFEQPGEQNEAAEAQSRIEGSLGRIQEALDAREIEDRTSDSWFSRAYYVDQLKLHNLDEGSIFDEDRSVRELDRPLLRDRLRAYKEIVHAEHTQPAREAPRPGAAPGSQHSGKGSAAKGASSTAKGSGDNVARGGGNSAAKGGDASGSAAKASSGAGNGAAKGSGKGHGEGRGQGGQGRAKGGDGSESSGNKRR